MMLALLCPSFLMLNLILKKSSRAIGTHPTSKPALHCFIYDFRQALLLDTQFSLTAGCSQKGATFPLSSSQPLTSTSLLTCQNTTIIFSGCSASELNECTP